MAQGEPIPRGSPHVKDSLTPTPVHLFHLLSPVGAVSSQPWLLQPLHLLFLIYLDFLLPASSRPLSLNPTVREREEPLCAAPPSALAGGESGDFFHHHSSLRSKNPRGEMQSLYRPGTQNVLKNVRGNGASLSCPLSQKSEGSSPSQQGRLPLASKRVTALLLPAVYKNRSP